MIKHSLPLLFVLCSVAASAQGCVDRAWASNGEPYSVAVCRGSDPLNLFQQVNAGLLQVTTEHRYDPARALKLDQLAKAAKAALEAGLNGEAKSYAQQTLTLASQDRCINSPSRPQAETMQASFRSQDAADRAARDFCMNPALAYPAASDGDAVATGNLVLGRLALLQHDVKQAEFFLAQSGKIKPSFHSALVGPNMTLALELLKHQRPKAVLLFLDDWSKIWQGNGKAKLRSWKTAIRSGAIPDFGANLLL